MMDKDKLPSGNLTPRSNSDTFCRRYSGGFGQPDGFGSVLDVRVNKAGDLCFTLYYKTGFPSSPNMWSVTLTNEQRKNLGAGISNPELDPTLWEDFAPIA